MHLWEALCSIIKVIVCVIRGIFILEIRKLSVDKGKQYDYNVHL